MTMDCVSLVCTEALLRMVNIGAMWNATPMWAVKAFTASSCAYVGYILYSYRGDMFEAQADAATTDKTSKLMSRPSIAQQVAETEKRLAEGGVAPVGAWNKRQNERNN